MVPGIADKIYRLRRDEVREMLMRKVVKPMTHNRLMEMFAHEQIDPDGLDPWTHARVVAEPERAVEAYLDAMFGEETG